MVVTRINNPSSWAVVIESWLPGLSVADPEPHDPLVDDLTLRLGSARSALRARSALPARSARRERATSQRAHVEAALRNQSHSRR